MCIDEVLDILQEQGREGRTRGASTRDAVDAHSCVDTDTEILPVEQYTTVDKYSLTGCFDSKVFVNCLHVSSEQDLRVETFCS